MVSSSKPAKYKSFIGHGKETAFPFTETWKSNKSSDNSVISEVFLSSTDLSEIVELILLD